MMISSRESGQNNLGGGDSILHPGHDAHSIRYGDAAGAYCIGRFGEAARGFAELVEAQCPPAATYLAQMYLRGEGVPADVQKGLELMQVAASWGDSTAAFNLGALHQTGAAGVPKYTAALVRV
jgi:TPR repeat protein